jgi:hypothetical protein
MRLQVIVLALIATSMASLSRGCKEDWQEWNERACNMFSEKCGTSQESLRDYFCNPPSTTDGGGCGSHDPGWSGTLMRCQLDCFKDISCDTLEHAVLGDVSRWSSELSRSDPVYSVRMCIEVNCTNCAYGGSCWESGFCTKEGNTCIAATNTDCKRAFQCNYYGKCTAQNNVCVVASDKDCSTSWVCNNLGYCKAHSGECVRPTPSLDGSVLHDYHADSLNLIDSGSDSRLNEK